ncbi:Spo0B domain-containing protein [Filobacillus milosensis]|uniref:Spo0B domain-containing protein n=1 Tax=Filobacillus milosensis TaxID=94137 RepID=UPI001890C2AB|nr:Spo0B domain-containing protein [Filobacillus milosensis]
MSVNVEDVLDLLRLYRHDLMNDLQLVQGYGSMKKHDVSMEKLNQLITKLGEDRLLQTLDAPQLVYWLFHLKLNSRETKLEFDIEHNDQSLQPYDEIILNDGKHLIQTFEKELGSLSDLHIRIEIKYEDDWYIKYRIKGNEQIKDIVLNTDSKLMIENNEEETSFVFSYK